MSTRTWIAFCLLATLALPTTLARPDADLDVRLEARADLSVVARAAAEGEGRVRYEWDWGDGTASVGAKARHAYEHAGVYRVVVRATDEAGREWCETREVRVREVARAEHEAESSSRSALSVGGASVRASVDISLGGARAASSEEDARVGSESELRVSSHDRRDAPGPAPALVGTAAAALAFALRRR